MDSADAALVIKDEHTINNKFPILDNFTLYIIFSEDDITKADQSLAIRNYVAEVDRLADHNLTEFVKRVGMPVMNILESCRLNNATFNFKGCPSSSQFKKRRNLFINGTLVAEGDGKTVDDARHDAAAKALQFLLKAKQPVVYKTMKDTFLHENEAIPGLCLSYDVVGTVSLTFPESVITKSCSKSQLAMQWHQIRLSDLFCAMLVIDSKIISLGTARKAKTALKLCAAATLTYLEAKQSKSSEAPQQQNPLNHYSSGNSYSSSSSSLSSSSELPTTSLSELPPTSSSLSGLPPTSSSPSGLPPTSTSPSGLPPTSTLSSSELVPGLTLLLRSRVPEKNLKVAQHIIFKSAKFSGLECHAPGVLSTSGGKVWSCDLQIGGTFIARGSHKQLNKARAETFRKGLELLLKTQHCKKYDVHSTMYDVLGRPITY